MFNFSSENIWLCSIGYADRLGILNLNLTPLSSLYYNSRTYSQPSRILLIHSTIQRFNDSTIQRFNLSVTALLRCVSAVKIARPVPSAPQLVGAEIGRAHV